MITIIALSVTIFYRVAILQILLFISLVFCSVFNQPEFQQVSKAMQVRRDKTVRMDLKLSLGSFEMGSPKKYGQNSPLHCSKQMQQTDLLTIPPKLDKHTRKSFFPFHHFEQRRKMRIFWRWVCWKSPPAITAILSQIICWYRKSRRQADRQIQQI